MNIGKYGEQLFKQVAIENYEVLDLTDNPDYWSKDIDFILTSKRTGARRSFEVKWDTRINRTGNLYLELTNIHSKQWNGEGWYKHCEADYLAYGDAAARIFYIIPLADLRERVKNISCRLANCGLDSTGLLVPLKDI